MKSIRLPRAYSQPMEMKTGGWNVDEGTNQSLEIRVCGFPMLHGTLFLWQHTDGNGVDTDFTYYSINTQLLIHCN